MRWLITGSRGQLGQCLAASIQARAGEDLVKARLRQAQQLAIGARRGGGGAGVLREQGDLPDHLAAFQLTTFKPAMHAI